MKVSFSRVLLVVNVVVDKEDSFADNFQIFIDAVWYCRLLCSTKDDTKCKLKCDDDPTVHNGLPPMVSEEEMKILIEIQLLTLIACGVRITQLKFAGDKVGTAMGMTENIVIGGLNSWKISSLVSSYLPKDCECYLVKHTARYFHQFAMLDKVVLGNIDLSALCSTSEKTGKATQICPDQKFMEAMSIFVYEEVYLLNRFYKPSGVDFLENVFNSIKSTAPLHLLLAGVSSFYEFSNMVMIKYGSFNARRDVNSKSVKRVLNPIINRDIVPKTKILMKSAAAAVLNDLMPQPRVLCCVNVDDDDIYGKLMERQEKSRSVATAFWKLNQRFNPTYSN